MKRKTKILFFSLMLILTSGSVGQVLACFANPNQPSVCDMYGRAKAVFTGKIIEIKEQKQEKSYSRYEIIFQVRESFLGVKKSTRVSVFFSDNLDYCGFEKGKSYLVYAYKGDKEFSMDVGTRTRLITEADEDLTFLRDLTRVKSSARIYGTIEQIVKSSLEDDAKRPVQGIKLKIEQIEGARKVFEVVTDADGNYEISGIAGGKYEITQAKPSANFDFLPRDGFYYPVQVNDGGCARQNFILSRENKISGRVFDAENNPVKGVEVEIISINVRNPDYYIGDEFGHTDSNGDFIVYNVPPGLYTIGVNYNNPPDDESPFPPTFYPGVPERTQAQIIEVSPGQDISDIEFQLPAKLNKRKVKGSVVWADGTPAAGVQVYIKDQLHDVCCVNSEVITDAQGRFVQSGFENRKYRVWAFGQRNPLLKKDDYGFSSPFVLNEKTGDYIIILDKTDSWLTDMDDDNEKELEINPANR